MGKKSPPPLEKILGALLAGGVAVLAEYVRHSSIEVSQLSPKDITAQPKASQTSLSINGSPSGITSCVERPDSTV